MLLYVIPRTAVLGALLLAAYFGSAVAMHIRTGDPLWPVPVSFDILTWLGLMLRRPHMRRAMR